MEAREERKQVRAIIKRFETKLDAASLALGIEAYDGDEDQLFACGAACVCVMCLTLQTVKQHAGFL